MDSAYEVGHVQKLQAQHTRMQEKTFTNWINNVFQHGRVSAAAVPRSPPLPASQLPGRWALEGWLRRPPGGAFWRPHSTVEARAPS